MLLSFAVGPKETLGGSVLLPICTFIAIYALVLLITDHYMDSGAMLLSIPCQNNDRYIELQLAGRFLKENHSLSAQHPSKFAVRE